MTDRSTYPPRPSTYVTPATYQQLRADIEVWNGLPGQVDWPLRADCEAFLHLEARLLDQGRFEEWLDLYDDQCLYWVPGEAGGGDPVTSVMIAFDDRRRLEDRVVWLRSAFIWSQIPRSRTVRALTNVEAVADGADLLVRSNFTLHDVRAGGHATHLGWYLHRIDTTGDTWRVRSKQVHLADCDQPHENLSLIF